MTATFTRSLTSEKLRSSTFRIDWLQRNDKHLGIAELLHI